MATTPRVGTVATFDGSSGLGTLVADGDELPFHCTAITDGTRTIEVGTTVAFVEGATHLGAREACSVAPLVD